MKKLLFTMAALALLPALSAVPGPAAGRCPAPLPAGAYATRCTGGEAVPLINGARVVHRDCAKGAHPSRAMAEQILALIEKLRCTLGERVVVTSGYRSWRHNLYSWAYLAERQGTAPTSSPNAVSRKSKHMQGKAVDFYVRGLSFQEHRALLPQLRDWAGRLELPLRGSREAIWAKAYRPAEGRDPDNLHAFPYIHVELRR